MIFTKYSNLLNSGNFLTFKTPMQLYWHAGVFSLLITLIKCSSLDFGLVLLVKELFYEVIDNFTLDTFFIYLYSSSKFLGELNYST